MVHFIESSFIIYLLYMADRKIACNQMYNQGLAWLRRYSGMTCKQKVAVSIPEQDT